MNFNALGKFNCLEQVEISVSTGRSRRTRELRSKLDEFLCCIRRVKVVVITQYSSQNLMEEGFMHCLESLCNVQHLGICISSDFDNKMIPLIISLLRAVPNFTTLSIRSPRDRPFISHETTLSGSFITCPFLFVKVC